MSSNHQVTFLTIVEIDDILLSIKEYVGVRTFRAILNVSKRFKQSKKRFLYWKLTNNISLQFYEDTAFRKVVESVMVDPSKQLSLFLYTQLTVNDVSELGNVHTLNLNFVSLVSDVSALGNVHTLRLLFCDLVSDVSALGNVQLLDITGCKLVRDVSALGNVHTLKLSHCVLVSDVSALGNMHKLDITGCELVSDVSALGNVHTL
jgi:hypothetical protein